MSTKPTVATIWLQGCSGCHISLLDLHEGLVDLLGAIDLVAMPLADVKEIPKVDIGIVEGAVANEENREALEHLRAQCTTLVALGTCACYGGLPSLRNLHRVEDVLQCGYVETSSTVDGAVPVHSDLPHLLPAVKAVQQVVKVDAMIPGCPPESRSIAEALKALLAGQTPKRHTHNLCVECDRHKDALLRPTRDFVTQDVCAPNELEDIDPAKCFLEQGVMCLGPATAAGCGGRCLLGNMPCRGCMGPTPGALEQGAKMVSALSSILPAGGLMFMEDVVGSGYRYCMATSIIPQTLGEEA